MRTPPFDAEGTMISALASSLRNRYRQSLERRTASLNPQTRENIAREIHSSTVSGVDELKEINESIEQAQLSLQELEEKRRFVAIRLTAYQYKLDQRAKILRHERERWGDMPVNKSTLEGETKSLSKFSTETSDSKSPCLINNTVEGEEEQGAHVDEEAGRACLSMEELDKQQLQLQRDQRMLEKIEKSQREMDANARELQKRIFVLERKRDEMLAKTKECRDFLVAAAQIEREQEAEDDSTVESHEDVEEGQDEITENELAVLLSESSLENILHEEENDKTK